jgi:hypothetical protein
VKAGGEAGGGDLGQVAELGDQDDRDTGPGDPPESGLPAVQFDMLVAGLVAARAAYGRRKNVTFGRL